MKAISVWEPWASLIRCKAKTIETRGWYTKYRGPLLICASKGGLPLYKLDYHMSLWEIQCGLAPLIGKPLDLNNATWPGVGIMHLNHGKAVALANLTDCKKADDMTLGEIGTDHRFGDFSSGRFAWILSEIKPVEYFRVTGKQGFFNVPDELIKVQP